jgi:hypothetical protein
MGSKLAEALRKNRERSSKNFLPFFKFPEGKTDIRILPAAKGDDKDDWFLPVGFHYNVDEKRPIGCRYETNWEQERCPICDLVKEMRGDGLNDEANRISVRRQYLVRAIVRGEEDTGAQIVRLPSTLFQSIGEIVNDEEAFGEVLNPGSKGRYIRVFKTGKNLDTKYSAQALPKNEPALEKSRLDELKEILSGLTPISSLVEVPSFDEVEKVVENTIGYTASSGMGEMYEDDDEETPDDLLDEEGVDDFFTDDEEEDTPDDEEEEENDPDAWMNQNYDDDDDLDETDDDTKSSVKADLEAELGSVVKKRGRPKTKRS